MFKIDDDLNLFAKAETLVTEWENRRLHPRVKKIVTVLAQYLHWHGYPCVITEIHRDDGGIHNEWRAVDVRSNTLKDYEAETIRKKINSRFVYGMSADGTKKLETIPPLNHPGNATQSTAPHFHVQVPSAVKS